MAAHTSSAMCCPSTTEHLKSCRSDVSLKMKHKYSRSARYIANSLHDNNNHHLSVPHLGFASRHQRASGTKGSLVVSSLFPTRNSFHIDVSAPSGV